VSTEFHVDGIPFTVVTVVYSVCYTELPKIPRNNTEFCVMDGVSTDETFWTSAEERILCGSDFHSAEFRGKMVGDSAE
jgi:hypothetical protein